MSSQAIETQGTIISIGSGDPIVYTEISEVKSFTGPGGSAAVIDVTHLRSTAKEKRMGLADEGQLSMTINYVPTDASHVALRAARAARTKTPFQLEFTDGTIWTFEAFVLQFSTSGGVDNVVEGSVTLEITGSITEV